MHQGRGGTSSLLACASAAGNAQLAHAFEPANHLAPDKYTSLEWNGKRLSSARQMDEMTPSSASG